MSRPDPCSVRSRQPALARLLLLFLLSFLTALPKATPAVADSMAAALQRIRHAAGDSLKIEALAGLAKMHYDYLDDRAASDSLAEAAVLLAGSAGDPRLLALARNLYIESTDHNEYRQKGAAYGTLALLYARPAGDLPLQWRSCRNLAELYYDCYEYRFALIYAKEALAIARKTGDRRLEAESRLLIGACLGYGENKMEGYRQLMLAKEMAESTGDPQLMKKCLRRHHSFYLYNKLFDEAADSKLQEMDLIRRARPIDSTALMWGMYELGTVALNNDPGLFPEKELRRIIRFADATGNLRLRTWAFAQYRGYLLETDNRTTLFRLYTEEYPGEFSRLAETDPDIYYRLKAFFFDHQGEPVPAQACFTRSETLMKETHADNPIYQSVFYQRYGSFLVKQGNIPKAMSCFERSLELAGTSGYPGRFEYMREPCRSLERLSLGEGDYRRAWHFASEQLRINDSIRKNAVNDRIMAEAVRRERVKREQAADRDQLEIRQKETQRNWAVVMGVVFIAVALVVLRQKQLLGRERKRSEDLLRNILPREVAEELKIKKVASARYYGEVTVMFTDFRDFTRISEKMGARELVELIHFYFTAFDRITSRYNLEKIKIIGDSYMCAGGLPVPNSTHAADAVSAALALQAFVEEQKELRKVRGEPWFELRIGIHTGPVVAGVVGEKKFAYDIWGDTVNTASRLEGSGEPGKINISGATHHRIAGLFHCTYRGHFPVKNKEGAIDMYFAEGPVQEPAGRKHAVPVSPAVP